MAGTGLGPGRRRHDRGIPGQRAAEGSALAGERAASPLAQATVAEEYVLFVDPAEIPAHADVAKLGQVLAASLAGQLSELMVNGRPASPNCCVRRYPDVTGQ